jgi:hypothetical protein
MLGSPKAKVFTSHLEIDNKVTDHMSYYLYIGIASSIWGVTYCGGV